MILNEQVCAHVNDELEKVQSVLHIVVELQRYRCIFIPTQ